MTYLYVLLKEWKMVLITLLSFVIVILLLTGSKLESEKAKVQAEFLNYKKDQTVLVAKLETQAKTREAEWSKKIAEVETNAVIKINQANAARRDADAAANRLSKQLSAANTKLVNASKEASANYAIAANSVFEECSSEYRKMAEKADGHAIDAERLSESFPTN